MNTEWKPIESAPKDGTRVLLWNEKFTAPCSGQFYGFDDWKMDSDIPPFAFQPTHWMPLPPAPTSHPIPTGATGEDEQAAFEDWMERTCPSGDVEAVQRQWESSSDYADFHAPPAGDVQGVPAEVMAALDRMCTPLDQSWLKGVTAEADAKCMQTIRDYILHRPACAPAAGDAQMLEFVREVAQQKPEKPDHWSSCSQCERNTSTAEELLEAHAAIAQQSQRKEA